MSIRQTVVSSLKKAAGIALVFIMVLVLIVLADWMARNVGLLGLD